MEPDVAQNVIKDLFGLDRGLGVDLEGEGEGVVAQSGTARLRDVAGCSGGHDAGLEKLSGLNLEHGGVSGVGDIDGGFDHAPICGTSRPRKHGEREDPKDVSQGPPRVGPADRNGTTLCTYLWDTLRERLVMLPAIPGGAS